MDADDRGESLIELIIAMAILGGAMIAIVGGFLSLAKISGAERDQARAFAALTAASEYAKTRDCVTTAPPCAAASNVPTATVPHGTDTTIDISAPSSITLNGGSALTQVIVTVKTGVATYTNTVVSR